MTKHISWQGSNYTGFRVYLSADVSHRLLECAGWCRSLRNHSLPKQQLVLPDP